MNDFPEGALTTAEELKNLLRMAKRKPIKIYLYLKTSKNDPWFIRVLNDDSSLEGDRLWYQTTGGREANSGSEVMTAWYIFTNFWHAYAFGVRNNKPIQTHID